MILAVNKVKLFKSLGFIVHFCDKDSNFLVVKFQLEHKGGTVAQHHTILDNTSLMKALGWAGIENMCRNGLWGPGRASPRR